jgi:cellobionic acid phosphorylase
MGFEQNGARYVLNSPVTLPNASGFLWNKKMMIQATCRGYANAQFMQPEPSKYVNGPVLEAQGFMQPEQPYYAHHPGRFFYIKDSDSNDFFSTPYEPVRADYEHFEFIVEPHQLSWNIQVNGVKVIQKLTLDAELCAELWELEITNTTSEPKNLRVYPYFPFGYRSWMNQSASYDHDSHAIICSAIAPYQKVADYFKNKHLHQHSYLLSETIPDAWETRQKTFEGEGGLHNPDGLAADHLMRGNANYQVSAAVMQFAIYLPQGQSQNLRFVFGPAQNKQQIADIRSKLFSANGKHRGFQNKQYLEYLNQPQKPIEISTPDKEFDAFINHWLPRQVFYHGDVNRLSTDPQTRNYLQDNMGLSYLDANKSREGFIFALSQQHHSGQMPDGILLHKDAQLKYINQVPHTDHCIWLPVCLRAYLNETADYSILYEQIGYADSDSQDSVLEHIQRAMLWLDEGRDARGLSLIDQGDWCDPMNMVGYKGIGVSAWLTMATAYSFKLWTEIYFELDDPIEGADWRQKYQSINELINRHFWHKNWYARGITDGGRLFGIEDNDEGKIFLNPQSWAMLSGACSEDQITRVLNAVNTHLWCDYAGAKLYWYGGRHWSCYAEISRNCGKWLSIQSCSRFLCIRSFSTGLERSSV